MGSVKLRWLLAVYALVCDLMLVRGFQPRRLAGSSLSKTAGVQTGEQKGCQPSGQ